MKATKEAELIGLVNNGFWGMRKVQHINWKHKKGNGPGDLKGERERWFLTSLLPSTL